MKRIMTLAIIAMIGIFAISSCTKKSDSPSYSMKATVGSTAFSANTATATLNGGAIGIVGWNGSGTTATPPYFTITITNFTGAATYKIDTTALSPGVVASYWPDATLTNIKTTGTGSVVVTSSSTTSISGTFSFKMTDGTVVSGGTFTAKRY